MRYRALLALVPPALVAVAACGILKPPPAPWPTPTPGPTPTPTPTPGVPPVGVPTYPEKLPRPRAGGGLQDNQVPPVPLEIVMAIPCCEDFTILGFDAQANYVTRPKGARSAFGVFSDGKSLKHTRRPRKAAKFTVKGVSKPTGWPLVSQEWIDYTRARGGANAFHRRFGPFLASEEPEWAVIGGPKNPDGTPNVRFWEHQRAQTAANPNVIFEDVPMDPWGFKYSQNGGTYIDMSPEAIAAFGHTWHPEHEASLRMYVENLGCYGNRILALDNEGELVRNYDPNFYRTMLQRYRALEREVGCGFVAMVGTSVRELFNEADYTITHNRAPLLGPIGGKGWSINNEHNPAFMPEQEASYFQSARNLKLAWALWRADATQAEYDETLDRVKAILDGGATVGCFAPPAEDPNWGEYTVGGASSRTPVVKSAQNAIGSLCKPDRRHEYGDQANDALAARLRTMGECASRVVDSTTIWDPEVGRWAEFHPCSPYDTGCWSNNAAHYPKGFYAYHGPAPQPGGGCPIDPGPVTEILCKPHPPVGTYDCTPKVGRPPQPVLPEGDPNRWACELKAMGAAPVYTLGVLSGDIQLQTLPNPMQFKIVGSGSGTVRCSVPATPETLCNVAVSR